MKVYGPITGKGSQTVNTNIHKSMFQSDTPGTRSVSHVADVVTQSTGNGILIVFYFDAICMELILCSLKETDTPGRRSGIPANQGSKHGSSSIGPQPLINGNKFIIYLFHIINRV